MSPSFYFVLAVLLGALSQFFYKSGAEKNDSALFGYCMSVCPAG
jgi:hypothetical protein